MPAPKFARDIMTREVTTVNQDAKLIEAALLMRSSGFRHLPVVNGTRLVGLLSDRDVLHASPSVFEKISPEEYNRIIESIPVEKVMAREPVTIRPDTPLVEVAKIMHERKYGSLPVVEGDNQLAGILTTTDLLGLLGNLLKKS